MGERYAAVAGGLDERQRRLWAGGEALAFGRGGVAAASRVTGLARATVVKGMREIEGGVKIELGRLRRAGGGRRPLEDHDVDLVPDLERLVADEARGYCDALAWTTRSVRELAGALQDAGHGIHYTSVPATCVAWGSPCSQTMRRLAPARRTAEPSFGSSIARSAPRLRAAIRR